MEKKEIGTTRLQAVIYVRTNVSEENYLLQMEIRKNQLLERAVELGYDIVGCYYEMCSANYHIRPELDKILELAEQGKISAVLVTGYEQISRECSDIIEYNKCLKKHGVKLIGKGDTDGNISEPFHLKLT